MKCHKCGCEDKRLFHHHKSYKPEVVVMMCMSCHKKLHNQLRKEGMCKIPVDELTKMSMNAVENSTKRKENKIEYYKNNIGRLDFYETMMPDVQLYETIQYNYKTGTVTYSSNFKPRYGKKLYYVDAKV